MNIKLLAVLSLGTLVACGDSGSSGSGGSGTGGEATGGAATGGAATGGNGTGGAEVCFLEGQASPTECQQACENSYDCGATCALCPGFSGDAAERDAYIAGCLETCANNAGLIGLVDPADCNATIETLSAVSPEFEAVCANGFGQ